MKTILLVFTLLGVACGSQNGGGLDPGFAGTWNGSTTVTFPGYQPLSYAGQLVIVVSGGSATVQRVCPDGSGSIVVNGAGTAAQWSGSLVCPPVPVGNCGAVRFTFLSGSVRLTSGVLLASGTASSTGCGTTIAATFSFTGTK